MHACTRGTVASTGLFGWLGLAAVLALAPACALDNPDPSETKDQFSDDFNQLNGEFGNGKADLFGLNIDPCKMLAPLASWGHDAMRSGLVMGVEGEGVLGTAVGVGGFDLVWDLYHQQLSVSRYAGAGIGVPGAGASVSAYAGAAFGFENGVDDWDGYFVTGEAEVGLPFLKDYVSLTPEGYVTGVDSNGDGVISPSEVLAPPDGVYGFSIGVSLGFDLLPDPLPVSGSVTEGYWQPYKQAVRHFYDDLSSTRMFGIKKMNVRLVEPETGEECAADWPNVDGEMDCVIEFGDPEDSYLTRSINTAYSICHIAGRCAVPLTWPMSATAMAIAALRTSGLSFDEMCPDYAN